MKPLLTVSNVSRDFVKSLDLVEQFLNRLGYNSKEEVVHAVDSVSFEVQKGEVIGIVGESGCGKSTLGKMVSGILQPTQGSIHFASPNQSNDALPDDLKIQMIFQDPFSSLNPRKKVIDILTEAPIHHGLIKTSEKRIFALEMLNRVGLDSESLDRYPHQFSGGQRQRIALARALILKPELIVLDEPTSALDRAVQSQMIDLLIRLQETYGLSYLFISHDLRVVRALADEIIVMRSGRVVEQGRAEEIFSAPEDDYTRSLIKAAMDFEVWNDGALRQ